MNTTDDLLTRIKNVGAEEIEAVIKAAQLSPVQKKTEPKEDDKEDDTDATDDAATENLDEDAPDSENADSAVGKTADGSDITTKAGSRHSAADMAALQEAHDHLQKAQDHQMAAHAALAKTGVCDAEDAQDGGSDEATEKSVDPEEIRRKALEPIKGELDTLTSTLTVLRQQVIDETTKVADLTEERKRLEATPRPSAADRPLVDLSERLGGKSEPTKKKGLRERYNH